MDILKETLNLQSKSQLRASDRSLTIDYNVLSVLCKTSCSQNTQKIIRTEVGVSSEVDVSSYRREGKNFCDESERPRRRNMLQQGANLIQCPQII